jgi:hypothetical protein
MSRPKHYSPEIKRFIVSVLYHEAQARSVPMTVLTNQLLADRLKDSPSWKVAEEAMQVREDATQYLAVKQTQQNER